MLTFEGFCALVAAFAKVNRIDENTASDLVAEIWDTPAMNDAGTHVIAGGREWVWPQEEEE